MDDLDKLVLAFEQEAAEIGPKVRQVVSRGSLNIKQGAARRVSGHSHLPQYPRSITYDLTTTSSGTGSVIGPDKDRAQGALGNIIEYGTVNNPPIPHLGSELDAEEPRFVRALEDLGGKRLEA